MESTLRCFTLFSMTTVEGFRVTGKTSFCGILLMQRSVGRTTLAGGHNKTMILLKCLKEDWAQVLNPITWDSLNTPSSGIG